MATKKEDSGKSNTKKSTTKKENEVKQDSSQPELNIALVGHVDHGKTTLTERLSGKWTDTHSEELKKGITIRLGYADFSIFYDEENDYFTPKSKSIKSNKPTKLLRKISLVDSPGHESLMATMLSGAAIVDGALLLVAANEKCPQAQTKEHLMALQISGIKNVIIVQNKIDLVSEEEAIKNYQQIRDFLKNTDYANIPIIPVSARANVNIDMLLKAIQEFIPTPKRNNEKGALMLVARSFDVNKPGVNFDSLKGGVLGGTVKSGSFEVGDEIEIQPGYMVEEKNKKIWKPLKTKITGIFTSGKPTQKILPGGSMALATTLDPSVVKSDSLSGALVGKLGTLPELQYQIKLETNLLERVVGTKEEVEVKPLAKKEPLMLNVNSAVTVGIVIDPSKKNTTCLLKKPVPVNVGDRVTISRRVGDRFRLIGYGIVK
jgi:translation initiation factor 2 subunit 3